MEGQPAGLSASDRDAIIERYAKRYETYGNDLKALDVGVHYEAQHVVHASIGDLEGKTLLDIGCGLAHYYEYLRSRGIGVQYIGYDFMPAFIETDRERYPEATFEVRDATNDEIVHTADYVVMCQVFNNRYDDTDNTAVVKAVLRKAFAAARIGVSIDMLSSYVNYRVPEMHYFSPEEMFGFAQTLTPFVRLRHDYAPRHFTLFLYKDAVRAERLAARIAELSGRAACVLTGNATTAIYLALRIVRERAGDGEVIVPAITCPSVVQAIVYAGLTPVFADVTIPDCTIDVAALDGLIGARTRAVIAIHIYGHAAPIGAVTERARASGIAVIEDVAQAIGGAAGGRPFGSFGDVSVLSFGGTKIIMAGGGGALLTDDLAAAERARELVGALPPLDTDPGEELLALSQRNLTHGLMDLWRVDPEISIGGAFRDVVPAYRRLWLHALADESPLVARIAAGYDDLAGNLMHRNAIASRYHAALAAFGSRVARSEAWRASGVVWRYTFLAHDPPAALALTRALRDANLNASNHYWSVAQLFADQRLPASTAVSRRVVNLWVDRTVSEADVERTIDILRAKGAA